MYTEPVQTLLISKVLFTVIMANCSMCSFLFVKISECLSNTGRISQHSLLIMNETYVVSTNTYGTIWHVSLSYTHNIISHTAAPLRTCSPSANHTVEYLCLCFLVIISWSYMIKCYHLFNHLYARDTCDDFFKLCILLIIHVFGLWQ